jgi:ATP-dependent Lhr-like helicase
VHLLAATDPANPFGAAIPWPRRGEDDRRPLARAAGAYVAIVDGQAALYVERGGSSFQALPPADDPEVAELAIRALTALLADGRMREVVATRVDGEPVGNTPWRDRFLAAGFVPGYRGLVLRGDDAPRGGGHESYGRRTAEGRRGMGATPRGAARGDVLVSAGRRRGA